MSVGKCKTLSHCGTHFFFSLLSFAKFQDIRWFCGLQDKISMCIWQVNETVYDAHKVVCILIWNYYTCMPLPLLIQVASRHFSLYASNLDFFLHLFLFFSHTVAKSKFWTFFFSFLDEERFVLNSDIFFLHSSAEFFSQLPTHKNDYNISRFILSSFSMLATVVWRSFGIWNKTFLPCSKSQESHWVKNTFFASRLFD